MPDVGGVQSVLLVVMLGISALVGPTWWSAVFTAILSAAYAVVLATSGNPSGFDKAGQWQIVTTGMVVCVAFAAMVRRELEQTRRAEHERQAERDRERELHAERLERLNESLREASELKSSFVAMASHELRTPLTSIEGFASTMRYRWNELSDADKLHFVEVIDSQASRLGRLVTDLLTVSKIEAGRVVAHREPTALEPAIRRAVEAAPGTPGELVVECDATAPAALVDPDHLQQMLLNYLANARAYAAPPITLVVADEGATVRIEVRDSGPGVDATFAPRLFDRFTRSPESARSDDSGGTGLGLSIVQGLAVSTGGEAWFEPGDPSGATFCLRLPVA
jgi:signal transduction histidine kinase